MQHFEFEVFPICLINRPVGLELKKELRGKNVCLQVASTKMVNKVMDTMCVEQGKGLGPQGISVF